MFVHGPPWAALTWRESREQEHFCGVFSDAAGRKFGKICADEALKLAGWEGLFGKTPLQAGAFQGIYRKRGQKVWRRSASRFTSRFKNLCRNNSAQRGSEQRFVLGRCFSRQTAVQTSLWMSTLKQLNGRNVLDYFLFLAAEEEPLVVILGRYLCTVARVYCCQHAEQILGFGKVCQIAKKCLSLQNGLRDCEMCIYRKTSENNRNTIYLTFKV